MNELKQGLSMLAQMVFGIFYGGLILFTFALDKETKGVWVATYFSILIVGIVLLPTVDKWLNRMNSSKAAVNAEAVAALYKKEVKK